MRSESDPEYLVVSYPALPFVRLGTASGFGPAVTGSAFGCDSFGLYEPFVANQTCDRRDGTRAWFISLFHDAAWYDRGQGREAIAPGQVVCWRPGSRQRYGSCDGVGFTHSYCFPAGLVVDRLMGRLGLPAGSAFAGPEAQTFATWLYAAIQARVRHPDDQTLVEHAVVGLLKDCALSAGGDAGVPGPWRDLRLLLDTQFARPWTLAGLARRLAVSPWHLSRSFKRWFGVGPIEHLLRRRLDHADYLLTTTALSIGAIAREVGYDDQLYFSRLYRRRRGMTPTQRRHGEAGFR